MNKLSQISGIICIVFLIWSCNDLIEYSYYNTNIISKDIQMKKAGLISNNKNIIGAQMFAPISDVHKYNDFPFASKLVSLKTGVNKNPNEILGIWLMANKNVKVEIYKVGAEYHGKVIWMDEDANKKNFSVGGIIIDNMLYNSVTRKYEGGKFYGRGHKLNCELNLVEKNLIEVRVSKGFLYEIRYCTRVN